MNEEEKIPYLVENKERDTFTIYVKGTKPYLELKQENKQLKEEIEEYKRIEQEDLKAFNNYDSILTELEDTLKRRINAYEERQNQGIDLTEVMTIRLASDKDTLDKIQKLKEKYK